MPRTDQNTRNRNCIEHMLKYCGQIEETLDAIQNDKEKFLSSHIYQNAVAMCILQLGELTKQLTPEFTAAHRQIPWSLIAKTRDNYAHHYGVVDFELVWEAEDAEWKVPSLQPALWLCDALSYPVRRGYRSPRYPRFLYPVSKN